MQWQTLARAKAKAGMPVTVLLFSAVDLLFFPYRKAEGYVARPHPEFHNLLEIATRCFHTCVKFSCDERGVEVMARKAGDARSELNRAAI